MIRILLFLTALVAVTCTDILAVSGTAAWIVGSGPAVQVLPSIVSTKWFAVPYPDPSAKWIWNSSSATPAGNITITHDFTIVNPGAPLTLTINVDNLFTFDLNGVTGSGTDWHTTYHFTIPTDGIGCGEILTLTINAVNTDSVGGVLYAITSPSYNASVDPCPCPNCSKTIPGCLTCVCDTFCSSCDIKRFFKYDPVQGKCVCIDGYYLDPKKKKCIPCPDKMHCKTCDYNVVLSRVECTTCSCEQHRILYPRSGYCGCANGTECCDWNSTFTNYTLPVNYSVPNCCM